MLPVEEWNAQISLLTGMAAASLMVYARVGLLRTLPPPDPRDVQRLHRTARALRHRRGPPSSSTPTSSARSTRAARHAAMVVACTRLLRGVRLRRLRRRAARAAASTPRWPRSTPTCTAPLRRLVDRYAGEVCVALCAGTEVPAWVLERLDGAAARRCRTRAGARTSTSAPCSTWSRPPCCAPHVGREFAGVVVQVDEEDPQARRRGRAASPRSRRTVRVGADAAARRPTSRCGWSRPTPRTRTVRFEL